ncbi:HNH endonuclease [Brevibacillus agri]|uniref:HNH endonuclease n=1 Tax=Brevibacillus agri TaxID=51101 RepID=UPI0018CD9AC3|nr:HNH endonuclease [Brevibacillus agri]MBG9567556.1 restriction endonuclease [Brevibacillus agri]MBG9567601.1 restriction endonuclease [Brevibacillus agri]MED1642308.1 HNH endonuclease [Brevibacillus agri]MED1657711.1 HNH endonuclease [Brevibacillus agri]MED1689468.1 HNH endonuclease [Brevibacillus agri]
MAQSFYKTARWKHRREKVLRRDEYLCQECKRYGKSTAAATVHHIHPLEQYPEFALVSANLVSLCSPCHDAMHDRTSGELTAAGERWRAKVSPLLQKEKSMPPGTGRGPLFQ